jgi:hypothetical protein
MPVDPRCNRLMEEVVQGLLSMSPERIGLAEGALRDYIAAGGDEAVILEREPLAKLKLVRAAAAQSAQLWRGCIPQPGYNAAGPVDHNTVRRSLSVTG